LGAKFSPGTPEIIPENPVLEVKVPPIAYVEEPRVILTDEEVIVFWSCEEAELEIRMLGFVARCEGGMRTRDCTAWDWTMIDRERFASCIVPRTKTDWLAEASVNARQAMVLPSHADPARG
jgi:hypothetical protein